MTTIDPSNNNRPHRDRLKRFCMVVSTAAAVATPVIAGMAYVYSTTH